MQGLSSISVVVSFDLENQILFNEGQMYVALSRVTKIDNFFLIVKYSPFVFKVNEMQLLNIAGCVKICLIEFLKIILGVFTLSK